MSAERQSTTLHIYLESDEPVGVGDTQESLIPKLTIPNANHPEWAVHALRRTAHVLKVIDFGSPQTDPDHYGVAVIYRQEKVSDVSKFASLITMVITSAGVSPPHL
jgi:hypothetical protein